MPNQTKKNWLITIPSIIYFIMIASMFYFVVTNDFSAFFDSPAPDWYRFYIIGSAIIYTIGFIFILRRWRPALIILTVITLAQYMLFLISGLFNLYSCIFDVVIFGILWTQYKKLSLSIKPKTV
ncbi:MAG: hypothetical protein JXB88_00005 [Spirochaetales bacterium]|nr:hypothetical protein [Spirochaetales bacterium]